jgi:hypothetical protein
MPARRKSALLVTACALHAAYGCGNDAHTSSPGNAGGTSNGASDGSGGAIGAAGGATGNTSNAGANTAAGTSSGGTAATGGSGTGGNTTSGGTTTVAGATNVGGQSGEGGSRAGVGGSAAGAPGGGAGTGGTAGSATCPAKGSTVAPWPGQNQVKTLDPEDLATSDLSGLTYEASGATGVLWAVNNGSSKLFRLLPSASGFAPDTENGWSTGKSLHYPGGSGDPDAEGVTLGRDLADGVYVCAEHDGASASVSRPSVLRFAVSGNQASLTATHEWNLTSVLPPMGANTGVEGITWVPDSYLTSHGFWDEGKGHAYASVEHPNHGTGLFFLGVEESGKIYVVALNHETSAGTLVATIATPNAGVMGLEFDRDDGSLWFNCDDGCGNQSGILGIDSVAGSPTQGRFIVLRQFQPPSSLPDTNNEGIAIAPRSQCSGGFKPFFWTDDADQDGHAIRGDSIPCAACF